MKREASLNNTTNWLYFMHNTFLKHKYQLLYMNRYKVCMNIFYRNCNLVDLHL